MSTIDLIAEKTSFVRKELKQEFPGMDFKVRVIAFRGRIDVYVTGYGVPFDIMEKANLICRKHNMNEGKICT